MPLKRFIGLIFQDFDRNLLTFTTSGLFNEWKLKCHQCTAVPVGRGGVNQYSVCVLFDLSILDFANERVIPSSSLIRSDSLNFLVTMSKS